MNDGVIIANGTDVPVEDADPIANFYATVSRMQSDGTAFFPAQSMTRRRRCGPRRWTPPMPRSRKM